MIFTFFKVPSIGGVYVGIKTLINNKMIKKIKQKQIQVTLKSNETQRKTLRIIVNYRLKQYAHGHCITYFNTRTCADFTYLQFCESFSRLCFISSIYWFCFLLSSCHLFIGWLTSHHHFEGSPTNYLAVHHDLSPVKLPFLF